jgi:hypothetical protein
MKLVFTTVAFLFIFFLTSCKKDKKDTQSPTITYISPTNGQAYKMFDTIAVNARVGDNVHLSYVTVTLTDANHSALQASYSVPITSTDFIFNIQYILTQFHLASGNYLMQITADDGYNTTSSYQSIYITESPTQLWGYCTVLKNATQTINQVDTINSVISSISLSQMYNGMKYGAYNQQLYVNGKNTQSFQSFYIQPQISKALTYAASASISQQDYTCIFTDGYKPYVGFLNGDVYSFTSNGAYSTSYRLNDQNFYPYYFTTTSAYGIGIFKSKIATVSDKIVSFGAFGGVFNSLPLGGNTAIANVVAVFEKSQDSLYILGNDATNQAVIGFYTPSNNTFSNFSISGSGKMLSATKVNKEYILIATTTGIYPVLGLSLNASLSPSVAQKLSYQAKLNRLTTASNTSLNSYYVATNSLSLISTKVLTDSIIDFEVITNK